MEKENIKSVCLKIEFDGNNNGIFEDGIVEHNFQFSNYKTEEERKKEFTSMFDIMKLYFY